MNRRLQFSAFWIFKNLNQFLQNKCAFSLFFFLPFSVKQEADGSVPKALLLHSGAVGSALWPVFLPECAKIPQEVGRGLRLPLWMFS